MKYKPKMPIVTKPIPIHNFNISEQKEEEEVRGNEKEKEKKNEQTFLFNWSFQLDSDITGIWERHIVYPEKFMCTELRLFRCETCNSCFKQQPRHIQLFIILLLFRMTHIGFDWTVLWPWFGKSVCRFERLR